MLHGQSFLCVIPARGGSKGIPRKNLKPLGGVPLLAWVCRTARSSTILDRTVCSTDSREIAELARREGVDVPFIRARSLSTDRSLVVDVLVDALNRMEELDQRTYDYLLLLQPTSPFVSAELIAEVAELAVMKSADTVITGYPVEQMHPRIMFSLDDGKRIQWFDKSGQLMARRQDLPVLYARSGLVYAISRRTLLEKGSIYGEHQLAVPVDPETAISIDTSMDLQVAEWIAASFQQDLPTAESDGAETGRGMAVESEQLFDSAWQVRPETSDVHWTRGDPNNQVQLAFRNHWDLFSEIMGRTSGEGLRSLEVGCGRGSLSCYFSDAGYDTTLLDWSVSVLESAQTTYATLGLNADFCRGDAVALPFEDGSFDVVFSIGLLEHFEKIEPLLEEQVRVLKKGGYLFVYAVPEKRVRVQEEFNWINDLLKTLSPVTEKEHKSPLYRNVFTSDRYMKTLRKLGVQKLHSSGTYSLPMISFSPDFPFTLMPPCCERILVGRFVQMLQERRARTGSHPWLCEEDYGHAFLVWGNR